MADSPRNAISRRTAVAALAAMFPAARGFRLIPARWRRLGDLDAPAIRALATAILPSELSPDDVRRAGDAFHTWARDYRAGAELSHPYGSARLSSAGADPSSRWALQLATFESDARRAYSKSFIAITDDERRTLVRAQLATERTASLGDVGRAQHVAVALLSHFFASSQATDLCYEAAIGKNNCRPLSQSPQQPVAIRRRESAP